MYKAAIYIISVLTSVYALSSVNFNNFFKKNREKEAKILVLLLALALGYLVGSFIIDFIEVSKFY
ncbi:MAG: DUF1146 domain-containing protein [Mollicutes bacterium]|nr:DUF1146 domain-containing protein [Mollicutes bacterium]